MDFSFLDEINKIVNKYEEDNRITGKNINILQIAGKDHNEVVICKLIAFLLNPDEKHSQKEKFLNLFLKKIYEPIVSEDELKSLQIITEFPANRRRIDIVIKSNKRFLPIEVKIWASAGSGLRCPSAGPSDKQRPAGPGRSSAESLWNPSKAHGGTEAHIRKQPSVFTDG